MALYRSTWLLSLLSILLLPAVPSRANAQEAAAAGETPEETDAAARQAPTAEAKTPGAMETAVEGEHEPEPSGRAEAPQPPPPAPAVTVEVDTERRDRVEAEPYNPFVDTRLTFVFADDNLLAGPGEIDEPSPGPQFDASGRNKLFFENYDTKDTGFETTTHLVLYKKSPTFFDRMYGEAALVLRLGSDGSFGDSSSYVRLSWTPEGWEDGEEVSFTGFPVTSDRFRLGYSYRLTWGGAAIFPRRSRRSSVPGARLQVTRKRYYAWLGGKSTLLDENIQIQDERATELVANYGILAGAGVDVTETLRLEANGGYFTRGTFATPDLRGEKLSAGGVSVQVAYHVGREVGTSIDLRLYKNDPYSRPTFFRPETYDGSTSYVVKAEVSYLVQTLQDPDNFGSTILQPAVAGDVNFALKTGKLRVFADAVYRDLAHVLFNVPSFVPFQGFTEQMQPNPEVFAAVGFDYFLDSLHLTPGLRVGVKVPAWVATDRLPAGVNPPVTLTGQRTVVVRSEGEFDILPPDAEVIPILAIEGTGRMDLSEHLAILGEVFFEIDNNRTTLVSDISGQNIAVFEKPSRLGFNLVLQARF